jgi:hypothetical protein
MTRYGKQYGAIVCGISRSRGAAGWRAGAATGDYGQRRGAGAGAGGGIWDGEQRGCVGKAGGYIVRRQESLVLVLKPVGLGSASEER